MLFTLCGLAESLDAEHEYGGANCKFILNDFQLDDGSVPLTRRMLFKAQMYI